MVYKGSKDWIEFKEWMKGCVLQSHLPENHKKDGDLKFPKYVSICSCGDVDCDNRRTGQAGLYGPANLDSSINSHYRRNHGYEDDEEEYTNEVYVKESEVELMKGQIHNLDYDVRLDLRKRLG